MIGIELFNLKDRRLPVDVGEKARNLAWMIKHGLPVPPSFVVPFAAQELFRENIDEYRHQLSQLLIRYLKPDCAYAVRSSASVEDGQQHSFAGQFNTLLNVRGIENVLVAIEQLLAGVDSDMLAAYLQQTENQAADHKLAVIIQEMVTPLISGVAFSTNPVTGLDEVIVEAVLGSGEKLVQEGQTPYRWVKKWGKWTYQPEQCEIDLALIETISLQTIKIAKKYRRPVDLEWVFDGKELYWVQLRPITALEGLNIYSNRISREFFPGMIKPLIWSVNTQLVNSAWIKLFSELIGPNNLQPEDLARSFGYRAYFNMGTVGRILSMLGLPRESLELMLGIEGGTDRPRFRPSGRTLQLLPRMVIFVLKRASRLRNTSADMARIQKEYQRLFAMPLEHLSDGDLLQQIDELYQLNLKSAEHNIVVPLALGISLMLLRRQLAAVGINFANFDLMAGMNELQAYDLKNALNQLAARLNQLDASTRQQIATGDYQQFCSLPGIAELQAEVAVFLHQFGHLSDAGNDFSTVPWRETPEMVYQMIIGEAERLTSEGTLGPGMAINQPGTSQWDGKVRKVRWADLKLGLWQRIWLKPSYQRARRIQYYREVVSSVYTYGYGLFRVLFLELSRRLVKQGQLRAVEDIFYLTWDEVRCLIRAEAPSFRKQAPEQLLGLIEQRKHDLEKSRDTLYPDVIYGDELPPVFEAKEVDQVLKGVPSSSGYYRGPVRVIRSIADFGKLAKGDVLVIPYSDVSWTPLFAKAGAVIAEAGGMLSHSSIVAREYNLPCVVSVPQACQLPDNVIVSVDGYKGEIYLVAVS